jgi:hypothetical protein
MGDQAISRLHALAYTLPLANTVYRVALPGGTFKWTARPRGQGTIKVRFSHSAAAAPPDAPEVVDDVDRYWTIAGPTDTFPGELAEAVTVGGGNQPTLYLETPDAGLVVEILVGI